MNTKRIVAIGVTALGILWILAAGRELLAQDDTTSAVTNPPTLVIAVMTPPNPTPNPIAPGGSATPIDGAVSVTTVEPATDPTPPAVTTVGPTLTEVPASTPIAISTP